LRLVWTKSQPRPRGRVNFAVAIERHLAGDDRLSDEEFVVLYATGRPPRARLVLVPRR